MIKETEIKDRSSWVYDIETLKSCFTYTAINIDTEKIVQYVIHKDRNDIDELINHLKSCKGQIGFNNINFDYPVIHYLMNEYELRHTREWTNKGWINIIYDRAQKIISSQDTNDFFATVAIKHKDVLIPQLDLFKVWHYNNKARSTSLKSLEISMNYPNVMDMPISHTRDDIIIEEVEDILKYNLNDVLATYEFYKKSLPKISLRKQIQAKYNIPCINFSDSKIGESLLLELYSKQTNTNPWDIKKLRTYRNSINFNDIIFDYIKFESEEFNNLLTELKSLKIKETKKAFAKSVLYKGFIYDYGTGGIHGCIKPGVYESDDKYIIIDADVASLYPNVAIKNRLYIEHLGETFIDLYDKDIVQERLRAKEAGEMSISDALKLSANSVYGKSNDINSFLYDPKYTMATTINGQLLLTMLAEQMVIRLKDTTVLQVNTDGITLKIPREQQEIYYQICKEWEFKTNLTLEYVEYSKMVIRDVNNYLAISTKGKVKNKGAFEVDKVVGNEPAYHKDNSFKIVPLAIQEYFVNNIPIENTIINHKNIYDFCGRQKFGRDSYGEVHYLQEDKIVVEKQQKNVRYYISKSNKVFIKQYSKGTSEIINKGYQVEIFNKFINKSFDLYNIDYQFYIKEANKIIDIVNNKQLKLF